MSLSVVTGAFIKNRGFGRHARCRQVMGLNILVFNIISPDMSSNPTARFVICDFKITKEVIDYD
jgi:hypothetical protein